MNETKPIIQLKDLRINLGGKWVHDNLTLDVMNNEVLGIVGKSGSGKTTLLRAMLMLQKYDAGSIRIFDQELKSANAAQREMIQKRWGVLFQQNALFSALTVLENIQFPLREKHQLDKTLLDAIAVQKLLFVGLDVDAANKYPSQLSGGMQKRAALARALALDPELLFLDEPTAGLDPDSASQFDELILNLQSALGFSIVMITHDLDTLWRITNRVAFLHKGKVLAVEPINILVKNQSEPIQTFFNGPRGRIAQNNYGDDDGNKR